MTSENRKIKTAKMMKKEKPMMSVTAIIQGTQARHWSRGNTCMYILIPHICITITINRLNCFIQDVPFIKNNNLRWKRIREFSTSSSFFVVVVYNFFIDGNRIISSRRIFQLFKQNLSNTKHTTPTIQLHIIIFYNIIPYVWIILYMHVECDITFPVICESGKERSYSLYRQTRNTIYCIPESLVYACFARIIWPG